MAGKKILVIEDERDLIKLLKYNLEKEGYRVAFAADGAAGLALAKKEKPDLILLDLMLPKMDGMDVCKEIRKDSAVPIIMLTAKGEEMDRVLGLEVGADDYVTKPFSVRELMARIKTILRRMKADQSSKESSIVIGDLSIDLERYEVRVRGKSVALSTKEFAFLKRLIEANGRALNRETLLADVWGIESSSEIDTRTVDQHIARLREKLGPAGDFILTIKNVGYRLKTEQ